MSLALYPSRVRSNDVLGLILASVEVEIQINLDAGSSDTRNSSGRKAKTAIPTVCVHDKSKLHFVIATKRFPEAYVGG
jgi:hypothetical protein